MRHARSPLSTHRTRRISHRRHRSARELSLRGTVPTAAAKDGGLPHSAKRRANSAGRWRAAACYRPAPCCLECHANNRRVASRSRQAPRREARRRQPAKGRLPESVSQRMLGMGCAIRLDFSSRTQHAIRGCDAVDAAFQRGPLPIILTLSHSRCGDYKDVTRVKGKRRSPHASIDDVLAAECAAAAIQPARDAISHLLDGSKR